MKISNETLSYIQKIVKIAKTVNIDTIIIEPDLVRAMDDDQIVMICQTKNVPKMEFGSIGLTRLNVFSSRLQIAKTQDDFKVTAVINEDEDFTRALIMKGKGIKIDYRCANPTTIRAPKQINDVLRWRIQLDPEDVLLLQQGQAAMGDDFVSIISNKGVSFELTDVNNDKFSHTLKTDVEYIDDKEKKAIFAHKYPLKTILSIFKNHQHNGYVDIGERGVLRAEVDDITLFVMPQH